MAPDQEAPKIQNENENYWFLIRLTKKRNQTEQNLELALNYKYFRKGEMQLMLKQHSNYQQSMTKRLISEPEIHGKNTMAATVEKYSTWGLKLTVNKLST